MRTRCIIPNNCHRACFTRLHVTNVARDLTAFVYLATYFGSYYEALLQFMCSILYRPAFAHTICLRDMPYFVTLSSTQT